MTPAVFVGADQPGEFEFGQMLAHGGYGVADGGGEAAEVALALREQPEYPQARGGREHAENRCGVL
jgi:hypothetical protein